ncbi:transcription termination/antitermination protein NusG [Methylorubrum aminovorans]|uniref:transcription termination/antitermination protein NusG n=1 Tax=Methylorubrum aminovorans TaxID=269069 RepID=UPI001EDE0BF8|nr:transcription termination/antitermination NusG family protein [Methylorubrum aminovorans]
MEPRRLNSDLRWYIARTLPRMGDRALTALHEVKVDTFQPRTSEVVVRRGRRVVRHAQLLMRTVFIGVRDAAHLDEARGAPGVAEIVSHPAPDTSPPGNIAGMVMRPARLDPEALQRFVDALVSGEIVAPMSVGEGSSVIVRAGPFASFPGTVEAVLPGDRLKVSVSIFGRATPVEVGLADVAIV